jgi:Na+/H+-dicarboxylate symporter
MTAGLPVEAIGIFLGVDAIADRFRTPAKVTGDLAVAAILARYMRAQPQDSAALGHAAPG